MSISWKEVENKAIQFSKDWEGEVYEKGESQTFYNEFFEIFGVKRRSVARFEEHVRKLNNKSGFIDLFWPGVLIVEHKSFGQDLDRAADQAGDYFDALNEDVKPKYQLVCDFQHFSLLDRDSKKIIDFNLPDLHRNVRAFAFILGKQNPAHRVWEHLNVKAATYIAKIHKDLTASGYSERDLEFFLTQLVFCLFADNTGIFQPRGFFADFVESHSKSDGSDLGQLLSHVFQILDTPITKRQINLDQELAEFPYINGGLFAERISIPSLNKTVREDLLLACQFDWSEVSPAIFGSLFQSVLTVKERRDIGGFATSETNIRKVLDDLFLNPLRSKLKELFLPGPHKMESLKAFRKKLSEMKFLDPACGSGSFLAVAYRELRKIELEVLIELERLGALKEESSKVSIIDVDQFYGIEDRPYSARIAKTAMWMTDHTANNELSQLLKVDFYRVPLLKEPTIVVNDALALDWESVLPSNECSYLFGNPPYKGPKNQTEKERKQIRTLANLGDSGGTLDFVCGWIIKAADYVKVGVRVGLVVINSVVQGEQAGQLWPLLFEKFTLEIAFAHQSFQWYSESRGKNAQVQVVIIGLIQRAFETSPKRLYVYLTAKSEPVEKMCKKISPYLIVGDELKDPYIVVKEISQPLNGFPKLKTGTKPIDGGYYILNADERAKLISLEPGAARFIRPFIGGEEFLNEDERYLLVLEGASAKELESLPMVKALIDKVFRYRKALLGNKDKGKKLAKVNDLYKYPTKFHITVLPKKPFLVVPEVSSERRTYVPIGWLEPPVVPSNLVKIIENASLEQFALLTSAMHMAWLKSVGGRLEGRNRYSIGVVYNTFPVPQNLDTNKLSRAAEAILIARRTEKAKGSTLAMMYDPSSMPTTLRDAHEKLDREVDRQYLGKVAMNDEERLVNLLNRYHEMRLR